MTVQERLDAEVAALHEEIVRLEALIPAAQAEHDAACAQEREVHPGKEVPKKLQDRSDRAYRRLGGIFDHRAATRKEIERLSSPSELVRRQGTNQRLTEVRKVAAAKKTTAREMGVPDVYLAENGNFKPGLDARYKSDLVHAALGIANGKALQAFEANDAEVRLQARGWTGFLTKKRESLAKTPKKARVPAKPHASTLAKVEAAAAAIAEGVDVQPDPKPVKAERKTRRSS